MHVLNVTHLTEYLFADFVTLQPHRLLLRPREGHDIRIRSSQLDITPAHSLRWHRDVYNNSVATVSFEEAANRLAITSEVILEHYDADPLDFVVSDYAVNYPFQYQSQEESDLAPFLEPNYPFDQQRLNDWFQQTGILQSGMQTYVLLSELAAWIANNMQYRMREEPGVQTPGETIDYGSGSCRDFAALFMEICKQQGLACRFVSGYLHAPSTEVGNGSTHAWAEVYLPGPGWKGFDPTIGELSDNRHITVAVARHPEWIPPVAGSFIGNVQTPSLNVDVQVTSL